jgi:RNA polymerase sigma-70 factor, ECF subfamily
MSSASALNLRAQLDAIYRAEAGRIRATLVRLLGDLELAEDAMQDAFDAALRRWPREGIPTNPRAWLISAGRFRAIDALRRSIRLDAAESDIDVH